MQLSNLFTILALAMTATALPAAEGAVEARTGGGGGDGGGNDQSSCNNNQQNVCCVNGGLLGGLLNLSCTVSLLTGTGNCNGGTYCCETNTALVRVSLPCQRILLLCGCETDSVGVSAARAV
ncbi:hypothetical protein BT67DRAFT_160468 [Trichocladium antarcticum]|uniref:Hydrophobin n=1 Tax=Trichocladium antarcticum TaxID=1450529 RepID=A0AAN6UEG9_9PEZI|nr:hypothetical protein BT67DRAFT_160468 [Trichocladium antarcticum]